MTTPTKGVRPAEPLGGPATVTAARAVVRAEDVVAAAVVRSHLSRLTGHGEGLDVVAPATGEVVATVRGSTPADVAALAARARLAQQDWAGRSIRSRARVVLAVHDLVLARREELTDLVQLVTGKARADAFLEVVGVLQMCRHTALRGPGTLAPQRRAGFLPGATSALVRREPAGVVGNVAAWNYPLVFLLGDTAPALLAGNAVLLKPDLRSTPLAGALLGLLGDAGLPDGLVAGVAGASAELGEAAAAAVRDCSAGRGRPAPPAGGCTCTPTSPTGSPARSSPAPRRYGWVGAPTTRSTWAAWSRRSTWPRSSPTCRTPPPGVLAC